MSCRCRHLISGRNMLTLVCLISIQQQKAVLPTNLFNLQAKQPLLAVTVQKTWKKALACLNNNFHFLCTSKLLEMSKFKWNFNRKLYYLKVFVAIICLPCIISLIRVRVKGNSDKSTASWETLLKNPYDIKSFLLLFTQRRFFFCILPLIQLADIVPQAYSDIYCLLKITLILSG